MRLCLLATFAAMLATPAPAKTYANPIDVDYRYNFEQTNERISYRTGADPVIVRFKGAYYLFLTLADGYWRSEDLVEWTFVTPSRWPMQSVVAPAVTSDGKRLLIMPSMTTQESILSTEDPASGKLDFFVRRMPELPGAVKSGLEDTIKPGQVPPGPWDPDLFLDTDGRWYLYWNSSNVFPLYGREVRFDDGRMTYLGDRSTPILSLHPDQHGWERFGQDHDGRDVDGTPIKPFMEGAWMNKVGGTYYMQYGAPGTEFNVYATGLYTATSPLGPFTYAPYNPVGYKPGGYVQGAGHGSTFQDAFGNWWNTGTPWIGHNWTFERRVGMWPAAFAADGQMRVATRFGDFPHRMPTGKVADVDTLFTGWMLLSYRKPVAVSSGIGAANATDENPRTYWLAGANRAGETLTVDLGAAKTVRAVQVNFADHKSERYGDAPDIYTSFRLEGSVDGRRWRTIAQTEEGARRRDRPNAYFELPRADTLRYVRYVHGHVGAATLALGDLRVFGSAGGRGPAVPANVTATRGRDQREAHVRWRPVSGAVGYNVRWGIRPDRLDLTYQVFADAVKRDSADAILDLRALTVGQGYHVAVEAFDESGVSALSPVRALPAR